MLARKDRVYILVDNLDKTWGPRETLPDLADFLAGLLQISSSITEEFRKTGPDWRQVQVSLLVFLRSDIFDYLLSVALERDKVSAIQMNWEDRRLLQRIIEERFVLSSNNFVTPEGVWQRFFTPTIHGMVTRDYLINRIIPRPRDIIYWCKFALNNAINGRHMVIEEEDILAAERQYSQYATEALIAENTVRWETFDDLIYGFTGESWLLTQNQVRRIARRADTPEDKIASTIELLCDIGFLGLETKPNVFTFIYDEGKKRAIQAQARRTEALVKGTRFAINIPYRAFLEIDTSTPLAPLPVRSQTAAKSRSKVRQRR